MTATSLRNPESGTSCDLELGRGLDYTVSVRTTTALEALTEQLLEISGTCVADQVGGLINNITILENIALPALYHGFVPEEDIERRIVEAFADCGLKGDEVEALCRKRPGEAGAFEKRLAGFVRCLLSQPEVLVYSRFFEGITRTEMGRAAALNTVFRARRPAGTAVYLMLHDMPDLEPGGCRRHDL